MVQSSAGVNSARRTTNPVTWHHITEDLNPQEHQSTCLELSCILRSATNFQQLSVFSLSVHHSLLLKFMNTCPCYTVPQSTQKLQEAKFVFYLTSQQVTDIVCSGDMRPGRKVEYAIQVPQYYCRYFRMCVQWT